MAGGDERGDDGDGPDGDRGAAVRRVAAAERAALRTTLAAAGLHDLRRCPGPLSPALPPCRQVSLLLLSYLV
jgi:hypothetical protein